MTPITVPLVAIGITGFLASVIALWLYGRLLKAKKATFLRSVAAHFLVVTLGVGAFLGVFAIRDQLGDLAVWSLVPVMLAEFLFACLCTCWLFRTTFGRAVRIWGLSTATLGVLGISFAGAGLTVFTERFVVPTGAMSPTIYGMHCYKVCDYCGYRNAVRRSYRLPSEPAVTGCTNCGRFIEILSDDAIISGDRILANKLAAEPGRWDLAVFHPPDAPDVMYVKRLVGLPGEEVEIRDGDIFIDGRRQRKPPGKITELWLPVHDTDFTPATPPADDERRWRSQCDEPLWQWVGDNGWQFSAGPGQRGELEFSEPVLDQLAYNGYSVPYGIEEEWQAVRDVRVVCDVSRFRGDGQMGFNWRFGRNSVSARVSAGGGVEITQVTRGSDGVTDLDAKPARAQGQLPSPLQGSMLTFAYRDGIAYVMQDDRLIASMTPEEDEAASQADDLEESQRIAIFAEDCGATLQRIQLFRDVYYLTVEEMGPYSESGTPNPIQLSGQQYLCFGDNSRQSRDSRFFGPVAADSVKGVVECIYWPPERWRRFASPGVDGGN